MTDRTESLRGRHNLGRLEVTRFHATGSFDAPMPKDPTPTYSPGDVIQDPCYNCNRPLLSGQGYYYGSDYGTPVHVDCKAAAKQEAELSLAHVRAYLARFDGHGPDLDPVDRIAKAATYRTGEPEPHPEAMQEIWNGSAQAAYEEDVREQWQAHQPEPDGEPEQWQAQVEAGARSMTLTDEAARDTYPKPAVTVDLSLSDAPSHDQIRQGLAEAAALRREMGSVTGQWDPGTQRFVFTPDPEGGEDEDPRQDGGLHWNEGDAGETSPPYVMSPEENLLMEVVSELVQDDDAHFEAVAEMHEDNEPAFFRPLHPDVDDEANAEYRSDPSIILLAPPPTPPTDDQVRAGLEQGRYLRRSLGRSVTGTWDAGSETFTWNVDSTGGDVSPLQVTLARELLAIHEERSPNGDWSHVHNRWYEKAQTLYQACGGGERGKTRALEIVRMLDGEHVNILMQVEPDAPPAGTYHTGCADCDQHDRPECIHTYLPEPGETSPLGNMAALVLEYIADRTYSTGPLNNVLVTCKHQAEDNRKLAAHRTAALWDALTVYFQDAYERACNQRP